MGVKSPRSVPFYEMGYLVGPDVAASIDRGIARVGEALLGIQGLDVLLSAEIGFLDSGVEREPEPGAKRPRPSRRGEKSLAEVVERLELLLEDVETCAAHGEYGTFAEVESEFAEFCDAVRADLARLRASTLAPELLDLHGQARGLLDEIQTLVFSDSSEE